MWYDAAHSLPPSFGEDKMIYFFSIFGLLTILLLMSEWLWRVTWAFFDKPHPLRHPVTVSRMIMALMLLGVLMGVGGDVFLVVAWPELSGESRLWLTRLDKVLDGASAAPFFLAWTWGIIGGAMVEWQLVRHPIPINLWPSWRDMQRPAAIGALVFFISASISFLR